MLLATIENLISKLHCERLERETERDRDRDREREREDQNTQTLGIILFIFIRFMHMHLLLVFYWFLSFLSVDSNMKGSLREDAGQPSLKTHKMRKYFHLQASCGCSSNIYETEVYFLLFLLPC